MTAAGIGGLLGYTGQNQTKFSSPALLTFSGISQCTVLPNTPGEVQAAGLGCDKQKLLRERESGCPSSPLLFTCYLIESSSRLF